MRRLYAVAFLMLIAFAVCAVPPDRFNWQAKLTGLGGVPLTGPHTLYFSIYHGGTPSGGGELAYSETAAVSADNGVVSHVVGTGVVTTGSLNAATFAPEGDVYLQVAIDTPGNVVTPRTRFESVPYALHTASTQQSQQIAKEFPVASGETIAAGDVVTLDSGAVRKGAQTVSALDIKLGPLFDYPTTCGTYSISIAALSSSRLVLAVSPNLNYFQLAVVGVEGPQLLIGPPIYPTRSSTAGRVAPLSDNRFVMIQGGEARICDLTGDSITVGAPFAFGSSVGSSGFAPGVAVLSPSRFVVVFADGNNSGYGTARVADIGTVGETEVIVYGPPCVFSSSPTNYPVAATLSSTKLLIGHQVGAGNVLVADVAGASISYGSAVSLGGLERMGLAAFGSDKFVVAYGNSANFGVARVGAVSGSTLSVGVEVKFNQADVSDPPAVAPISENEIAVSFTDYGSADDGRVCVGRIADSSISFGNESVFRTGASHASGIAQVGAGRFVTACAGVDGSVFLSVGERAKAPILGVAQTGGSAGSLVRVALAGISSAHSGLSAGTQYYLAEDGSLTTGTQFRRIGYGLSGSELLLSPLLQEQ